MLLQPAKHMAQREGDRPLLSVLADIVGTAFFFTWPFLVYYLFQLLDKLRPFWQNQPFLEFITYASCGLGLVRVACAGKMAEDIRQSKKKAFVVALRRCNVGPLVAERIADCCSMLLSRLSRVAIAFIGINLLANCLPDSWVLTCPHQLRWLDSNGDGVLGAEEVEYFVFRQSQKVFLATLSGIVGFFFLDLKRAPKVEVASETCHVVDETFSVPSFECWLYAKQMPQDAGKRGLIRAVASFDKIFNVVIILNFFFLPWTYAIGLRPQTVLALGGMSGLAIGLATKSLVGNVISGVLIFLKQPFKEGDEVQAEGGKLRGIVEEIGLVSTQINQLNGVPIHIPNSTLLEGAVANFTTKDFRLMESTVPVVCDDLRVLPSLVDGIQNLLESHAGILQMRDVAELKKQRKFMLKMYPPMCAFQGYGDLGANLLIKAYFKGGMSSYQFGKLKSEVLLAVNEFLLDRGVSIGLVRVLAAPSGSDGQWSGHKTPSHAIAAP